MKKKRDKVTWFLWEQEPLESKEEYEARLLWQDEVEAIRKAEKEVSQYGFISCLFFVGLSCLIGLILALKY